MAGTGWASPPLRRRNGVHVQKGLFEEYAAFGRANGQQPYLIPHRVEGCQITKEFNKRPSRHGWPDKAQYDAPGVSEAQYETREVARLDQIAGQCWFWSPWLAVAGGILRAGGFVAGVALWGGVNWSMELTGTGGHCASCHELQENVLVKHRDTIHYSHHAGVRATGPDGASACRPGAPMIAAPSRAKSGSVAQRAQAEGSAVIETTAPDMESGDFVRWLPMARLAFGWPPMERLALG